MIYIYNNYVNNYIQLCHVPDVHVHVLPQWAFALHVQNKMIWVKLTDVHMKIS
jgi:hypothetical protein